eukprot:31342-Pelagococcus_subviridis.AAC.18
MDDGRSGETRRGGNADKHHVSRKVRTRAHLVHPRARAVLHELIPTRLLPLQELAVHGCARGVQVAGVLLDVLQDLVVPEFLKIPRRARAREAREDDGREREEKRHRVAGASPCPRRACYARRAHDRQRPSSPPRRRLNGGLPRGPSRATTARPMSHTV